MILPSPTWTNHRGERLWNLECAEELALLSHAAQRIIVHVQPDADHAPHMGTSQSAKTSCYSPLPSYQRIVPRGRWWWPHISDGGGIMSETILTTLTEIYMPIMPTKGCEFWMPDSNDTIISPAMLVQLLWKPSQSLWYFFPMDQTTYNFSKPNLNENIYLFFLAILKVENGIRKSNTI